MSGSRPSIDGQSSSASGDWVTAYEDLRRVALDKPDGHARRAPGLALLLRAGIAGWMRACRSLTSPVLSTQSGGATTPALAGTVRAEVTMLLAEMALAAAETAS